MKLEFKSICVKTLLIILALSFVLFGVINFFAGVGNTNIAKIGNDKISVTKFSRYLMGRRNQYYNSDLSNTDLDFFTSKDFVNIALSEFIGEILFQNEVKKLNLIEPKEAVLYEITNNPNFQTNEGEFDIKSFKNLLARSNITEAMYIEYVSMFNSRNALIDLLISNNLINNSTIEPLFEYNNRYAIADIITMSPKDIKFDFKKPSKDEIETYYDKNMGNFIIPEKKIISSIEIDLSKYAGETAKNKLSEFEDSITSSKNIDELSKKFDIKKQTITYSGENNDMPQDLTQEILQQEEKTFSNVIYNDNNTYKVYYIEKILPSKTLTLDEATPQIINDLKEKAKEEYDLFFLEKMTTQMKNNDINKVVVRNGAKLLKNKTIYLNENDYPTELIEELYQLNLSNNFTKPVFDKEKNIYYIAHLQSFKQLPSNNDNFVTIETIKNRINNSYNNSILKLFEKYLIKTERVIINETVLNSIE